MLKAVVGFFQVQKKKSRCFVMIALLFLKLRIKNDMRRQVCMRIYFVRAGFSSVI